jgi:hypothetical protein
VLGAVIALVAMSTSFRWRLLASATRQLGERSNPFCVYPAARERRCSGPTINALPITIIPTLFFAKNPLAEDQPKFA